MDFFTRLIGGVSTPKKQAASNNPQQRLARFKKVYNQVLQTWHKSSALHSAPIAAENIRISFQRLTHILNDESRSPSPHLCLSFAASSQIYTAVARIAATAQNEGIVREAVALFAALIDSEEEDFLENENFSRSLMNFIGRTSTSGTVIIGEDVESEIVELLFGIAAKIRLQPEILPVWFTSKEKGDEVAKLDQKEIDFAGVTQKDDFPLCYQLIDHVHHEGRIGDFARTGLLYIFESASKSRELEKWIVESDLSTLMASSLGALYSQLSRKLSILHPKTNLPIILSLSDYIDLQSSSEAESVWSSDFKLHMDTFLSFLAFWQDVLEHCRSIDVRQTLIDHFQILFLQQLLYPSLLESSDVDGGSSVAVLTYLGRILHALDHPELIHMILHYLLALSDPFDTKIRSPRSPLAAKRRMSLMAMSQPAHEDDQMNPSLFNLVDLILTSTQSSNPQTVVAALRLVTVILSKNHHYAVGTLVKTIDIQLKEPQRTIGALNAEMEMYLSVAIACGGESGVDEAYATHLKDMQTMLESHPCSLRQISLDNATPITEHFSVTVPPQVGLHYLIPDDPLLVSLLRVVDKFLLNDVETNLALVEAITSLGSCAQLRLENWLAVDPSKYEFDEEEEEHDRPEDVIDEALRNIYIARQTPQYKAKFTPPLLKSLQGLQAQIDQLRLHIPDLDYHIENRKQTFHVDEEIMDAMAGQPTPSMSHASSSRPSAELQPGPWNAQIPKHVRDAPATPSRSHSPRGRKENLATPQRLPSATASPAPSRLGGRTLVSSPTPGSGDRSRAISPAPTAKARQPGESTMMSGLMTDVSENVAGVLDGRREVRFKITRKRISVEVVRSPNDQTRVKVGPTGSPTTLQYTSIQGPQSSTDGQDKRSTSPEDAGTPSETIENLETQEKGAKHTLESPSEAGNDDDDDDDDDEEQEIIKEASLNHILTNIVILQEFILELVALLQIRASLFQEVRFA
ncbi:hypothetical protein EJ05DRAFT_33759 [Pseudovirgaria hyperparasitica]|uniref:Retinoic acid induced 16-like protein-domain-containing protein n=1 Tax=Pseudovirgaria hyperparasitica TaxID=470096 RepID=A0A6A6WMC9_9PEZI|nr:uncharacterized protein EJ05DRAFT_33759 [Pseudovirgaria hyperparasitica]KAF2763312.1 hypothetical protein EJ05DRAFT_33759 [Pseudovirgaria hyperparasitica]